MLIGLLGGQRRRLYQANLDRLFNPKNGLSLAFFKKLTIAKIFIKPKLLSTYSTSSVSSTVTDYQHSRRAVLAWAVGPCGIVLKGQKDSTRRYANYAVGI